MSIIDEEIFQATESEGPAVSGDLKPDTGIVEGIVGPEIDAGTRYIALHVAAVVPEICKTLGLPAKLVRYVIAIVARKVTSVIDASNDSGNDSKIAQLTLSTIKDTYPDSVPHRESKITPASRVSVAEKVLR